ncbi:MAG: PilZ domain-containing protein [Pseudomonadota bacterium]
MDKPRIFRSTETSEGMRNDVQYSENENRGAVRKALQVSAMLQTEGGPAIGGKTVDISTSGICVLTNYSLATGESWLIEFDLQLDGKVYHFEAVGMVAQRVVASNGIRIGFQFKRVSMASLIAISRYMREAPAWT